MGHYQIYSIEFNVANCLASHWPCDTDFSGLSTYGLNGQRKGDEHPTYAHPGMVRFTLPYQLPCFYHKVNCDDCD